MDVQIKTRGVKLSDSLRRHIDEQVAKLDRINEHAVDAKLEIRTARQRTGGEQYIAQFTIQTPGNVLRAEVRDTDQRVAIDRAVDKMKRQIHRYHDRKIRGSRRNKVNLGRLAADQAAVDSEFETLEAGSEDQEPEENGPVVRTKRFRLKPMPPEEAIEQMELLQHDFFVFHNADNGETNVVYRRNDGDYGLIEPELG